MTTPYLNMNNEPNPQIDFTIHVEKNSLQIYHKRILEYNIKINETALKLKCIQDSDLEKPQVFILKEEKEIPVKEGHKYGNILYDLVIRGQLDYMTGDTPIRVNVEL